MKRYYGDVFYKMSISLEDLARKVGAYTPLTDADRTHYLRIVEEMIVAYHDVGLNIAVISLGNLKAQILKEESTYHDVAVVTSHVQSNIAEELSKNLLMCIPADKAEYYQREALFGEEVDRKFPKAGYDIREAGNCLASGNNTACVFHLMRVVEYGLRALAKGLKVKFPKPIEFLDWGNIIREIEREINRIEALPRTHKRERDLEFFHGAAAQFRHFKNAWRNHVMHTRSTYGEREATVVMVHVREFMQHIASRLRG